MTTAVVDQERLTEMVEKIPAFPQSVNRILDLTSSADCSPKEVVSVIEHDPVLTMKLLKMVNSAYFGLAKEVSSIKQAVVYVGINTVKNIAITMATLGVLPKDNKAGLDTEAVWMHSLKVGVIARMLAQERGVMRNDLASYFVAGLLHDIGKMVCAQYLSEVYKRILAIDAVDSEQCSPLTLLEKQHMGFDHAELGGMVARKWQLPNDLIRAIEAHHAVTSDDAEKPLVLAIAFANLAVHHEESLDSYESMAPEVRAWAGTIEEGLARLGDIEMEVEKAKSFIQLSQ